MLICVRTSLFVDVKKCLRSLVPGPHKAGDGEDCQQVLHGVPDCLLVNLLLLLTSLIIIIYAEKSQLCRMPGKMLEVILPSPVLP